MSHRSQSDSLKGIIDRWVNGRAILKLTDGQELTVARRFLPRTVREGDILHLHLHTEVEATQHREELARAILKEILSS